MGVQELPRVLASGVASLLGRPTWERGARPPSSSLDPPLVRLRRRTPPPRQVSGTLPAKISRVQLIQARVRVGVRRWTVRIGRTSDRSEPSETENCERDRR